MTPAEAIEAAELTEAETRYRNNVGRLMYEAGRRDVEAEMAERWDRIARPVVANTPAHAVLEERRWGPGGREHYADARPGDYPGRNGGSQMNQPDRALPAPRLAPEAEMTDPAADQLPQILAMAADAEPELEAGLWQTTRRRGDRSPSRNRPRSSGSWIRGLRPR